MSAATDAWGDAAFSPRRIALVGASGEPGKAGRLLLDNLSGYRGEVLPIHPSAREVLGRAAYPSVAEAPGPIDLAVIVTPAHTTERVIEDCARARVPVALLLSGGFAETGAEGAALEARLKDAAAAGGVRLIGPNCFGLIDTASGLNASLAMGLPAQGGVSLFTQSGSYGMAAFSRSRQGAIGFAKVVAAGNKADLNEVDALGCFGADPRTRVIALVLESLTDGAGLVAALRAVTPDKPVLILKCGRSPGGQRAAASHSAALAQDFVVARAVLRQAGAVLIEDGLTLFDVAAALDRQPPLRGRRVAIISNSGGTGVELADLLEGEGLDVPVLTPALQSRIARELPAHGSARNPVDVTTDWTRFAAMYSASLRELLDSSEVDAVVPVLLQRSALDEGVVNAVIDAARGAEKPVHVCWAAPEEGEPLRRRLQGAGVPCHDWAARTARVLACCRVVTPAGVPEVGVPFARPSEVLVKPSTDGCTRHELAGSEPPDDDWLAADHVYALLASWGLPVAPWRIAVGEQAAVASADELGFPVVLKAIRPGLVHKTEAGAVRLGLADAAAVRAAFGALGRALGSGPVLVQAQAHGVELMLGAVRDPCFGPIVVFGLGGVWAEALGDVAMLLAPIDPGEALRALGTLRGAALLDGLRGAARVDRDALAALISRFSICIARAPWCAEIDLNPLLASGGRFAIVDARLRVERTAP